MSDVKCPYCGNEQEISHDDGYGYEEEKEYWQSCVECDKEFKFHTRITFCYRVFCNGDHVMEQSPVPKYKHVWNCSRCDYYEVREQSK